MSRCVDLMIFLSSDGAISQSFVFIRLVVLCVKGYRKPSVSGISPDKQLFVL